MNEMPLHEHVCKNCGNTFQEHFCNRCGQKVAHRITLVHVLHDVMHVFLHADKGIISFIKTLVIYPGIMAREYVEGKRKIFNPFQYLILVVGIMVFLMTNSHYYESLMKSTMESNATAPKYMQKGIVDFLDFVKKNSNLITFLTLPVYALFSWLFFKKKGNNYAEHFTIQVFAQSWLTTVNMFFILGFIITNSIGFAKVWITVVLMIICLTLTYKQFYKLSWLKAVIKSIGVYAISYAVQVLIMGIGLVVYILMIKKNAH